MPAEPHYRRYDDFRADLNAGRVTCRQVTDDYLARIDALAQLNAFTEVYADEARARAVAIDQKLTDGTAGRLAGMVIGLKDVLSWAGHGLRAGSRILDNFTAQFTATAVQRLLDADAIIIGRQNCDEFAMGSSNESSAFGVVRNAADTGRVPGGSSGGSAVAVQAGLCMASIGSDTGGSVRQPAAFCGVVGLKPTYGRISRWGLVAYASSFDCIGPITNTVADAALLLSVMAGPDEFDSTVSSQPVADYPATLAIENQLVGSQSLRIGYLRAGLDSDGVAPAIRRAMQRQIADWQSAGHMVEPVEMPLLDYLLPTYYILTTAEASSNLSRFDGVRYGYRAATNGSDLVAMYKRTRTEGFGPEVRKRILLGTFALSASYYDAYYTKAQQVRRLIRDETLRLFGSYDVLLSPATPTTAFPIGEKMTDPLAMYLADVFTVQANITGCPAMSVPVGRDADGLPIGLHLMAAPFAETMLLRVGQMLMSDSMT